MEDVFQEEGMISCVSAAERLNERKTELIRWICQEGARGGY